MSKFKILFMMTGSIACYKACQVISRLVQAGHEVQVVASPSALQFVGNATFEGLTQKSVISDLYSPGDVMGHIHWMRWADLVIVAPATANYINKIAQGVGDDLLTTLFLAHDFKKPFLIAPAMNTSMYLHPMTQASIARLKGIGLKILETASGVLACGESGFGKLLDPDLILEEIQRHLGSSPATGKSSAKSTSQPFRVLVTAGGTIDPLDEVRVITNLSSGQTGARLAELLSDFGADVHLLRAESAKPADGPIAQSTFSTFHSLQSQLQSLLSSQDFDLVVHSAAISDYSVESFELNGVRYLPRELPKIPSEGQLSIHFKNNPKLVDQIKSYSRNKKIQLVAFKLTSRASAEERAVAVTQLKSHSQADYIVHNDTSEIDKTKQQHRFTIYGPDHSLNEAVPLESTSALAAELAQNFLKEKSL